MNLLKVLFASWLIGVGLSYFKDANIEYQLKCLSMSVMYFILSVFCYRYIEIELRYKRMLSAYFISILCMSMVVSSWFNFLFVNSEMYYLLVDLKQGDGFSWKNIYKTVELAALLTVGRNGLINLRSWIVCRDRWFNVIIGNNSTYNLGR